MVGLTADQVRGLRLRAQLLAGDRPEAAEDVAQVTQRVGGIQAQDAAAADRGLWARTDGLTVVQVEQARTQQRSIVRTWAMRGTLHLIPREWMGTVHSAFGLRFIRTSKQRYRQLGLTDAVMEAAVETIERALAEHGPLTRGEIAEQLAAQDLPHGGQITFHLIRRAAFQGLLCYGPERAGETAFVRVADWLGEPLPEVDPDQALRELTLWYLRAFGPAGAEDFAAWSGLPLSEARDALAGVRDELTAVELDGERLWLLSERAGWAEDPPEAAGAARMLPTFDSYLLAYRDRSLSVPDAFADQVHPGGGIIRPTILVDGLAAGIWSARRKGDRLELEVRLLRAVNGKQRRQIESQAADLGRFHSMQTVFVIHDPE